MKKINPILFAILFSISLLQGCGEDSENTESPSSSPTTPITQVKEDLTTDLIGVDSNNNGIRDDIDQLIKENYSDTPELKSAAEQKAKSLQKFLEATNKEEATSAAELIIRSTECVSEVLPDPEKDYEKRQKISKELEAWTANTEVRLKKYLENNALIAGSYFIGPEKPVCDS